MCHKMPMPCDNIRQFYLAHLVFYVVRFHRMLSGGTFRFSSIAYSYEFMSIEFRSSCVFLYILDGLPLWVAQNCQFKINTYRIHFRRETIARYERWNGHYNLFCYFFSSASIAIFFVAITQIYIYVHLLVSSAFEILSLYGTGVEKKLNYFIYGQFLFILDQV